MARVRAGIYQRISDDRAGGGLGVTRQEQDNRRLVETRGWDIAETYTDNDLSAFKGKVRPAYEAMLEAVTRGDLDAIVAWHPDRLHRSPTELERFIDIIEQAGIKVATVQGGEYDLSTASGRMTARIVGAVARHESEHKGERAKLKHRELAAAGKPTGGGTRPFGFEPDRVTHRPEEAAEIREMARRFIAGESIRGIARDLTERGVTTPTGKPWSPFSLRRLLRSARIAGLREHHGARSRAVWEPIVDRDTWETIRRILDDPARMKRHRARSYLLTGFAYCGLCEAKLVARPRADKRPCYVCATGPGYPGCGKIRSLSEPLEELVVGEVLDSLDGDGLARAIKRRSGDDQKDIALAAELSGIDAKLDELAEMWADPAGGLDRQSWQTARQRLTERREGLVARLDARADTAALGPLRSRDGDIRARWAELSFAQRRAVLGALLDRVVLAPAVRGRNFFDPDRVTIEWKA